MRAPEPRPFDKWEIASKASWESWLAGANAERRIPPNECARHGRLLSVRNRCVG
jgi:hypothetical protein